MTSSASDKCCRPANACGDGAGEMAASCAPAASATSAICAAARRVATKNIAHHARGAQSPPTHWQVAAKEEDDDRCSSSSNLAADAQNDAPRPPQPSGHKVAAAHDIAAGGTSEVDANLDACASAISNCQQEQEDDEDDDEETARCEIFKRWRDEAASEVQDIENDAEFELQDETGAADEIEEMGAHLSGRETTSEEGESGRRRAQSVSPRANRVQQQPTVTPTVLDEGRTGYSQPMASRDKRPRRARTAHAASNSAAAAGASAIAPTIAPATTNQNRTQMPTTMANFSRDSNIVCPNDSQLFTLTNNKFNQQTSAHQTGRPASAMAGSLSSGGGATCKQPDYWATCNPSESMSLSRTPPPPPSASASSQSSQQRVKTTRVRINSTSEQIQDPNWLIQMSRESELKQQSKRSGFPVLKSLHQKLKSTIVGSSSCSSSTTTATTTTTTTSGYASSQSGPSDQKQSSSATNSQQDYTSSALSAANSSTLPPPVPMTPIKMPVSILKQPGTSRTPVKTAQRAKSPIVRQQVDSTAQTRPPSRSTGAKNGKQPLIESSSGKHQQAATSKLGVAAKQTNSKKATCPGPALEPSESTTKQATAAGATQPAEAATSAKIDPAPIHPAINSAPPQTVTITTTMSQTTTLTSPAVAQQSNSGQQQQQQQQQQQGSNNRPVPICADGQVKVSGWKRNNLLAKTLSHFDEIRGNQRPIFMPTKITLPPEKKSSSPSGSSSASPQPAFSLPVPQPATHSSRGSSRSRTHDLAGGTRFADIVREAILKKSLLAGGATQNPASPVKRASQDGRAGERHQSCDFGNSPQSCQLAQDADGSSPAKRAVSADPGRSSVSSQSGGVGGLGQPKIRKQLHSDSTGAVQQQQQQLHQHGANSQQASPSHRQRRESGGGSRTSMAQIIAAAVAAASSEPATVPAVQRSSFSLPSASVAASSSRAFKLQLKNEQVLQQLRRQSNEHRESLTIDLNNNNNSDNTSGGNLRQESSSSANEGGGGGSVRLKDWKRLTSKLGLLTGRSERQMFAGAVRSSAGTPVHSSLAANPLRLTVSNQESRRLGARSGHRGSGCGGESSPAQAEQQANRSRLLVPGGYLFDATNRRHSSQSSDVNGAAVGPGLPASERKLSSSSMVVQPVSVPGFTCTVPLVSRKMAATSTHSGGGLKPNSGFSQRERRRIMSRSAAASPMLMAHQDSMCLRRSSDSEACGGSRLQVAMGGAATPVTSSKKDGGAGSSSRSSMSGASVFYGGDPQGSSGGTPQLATKTRPVVVNRDDLLHLLKVTGSGVSLNVIPSDQAAADSLLIATGEPIQHGAAAGLKKDNEQVHEDGSQEIAAIGVGDIATAPHTDDGAQSSRNRPSVGRGGGDERPSQACQATKHDLSWVVRRTSKVAVFQQKLRNKMRWHSKQKQATAELEAHERKRLQVALNDDDNDDSRRMINEPDKENNSMAKGVRDDGDADHDGDVDGEDMAAKNASNVLMDPTLIGDAIEMFLRTTMQQQQQLQQQQLNSSECYQDGTAEQDEIELEKDKRTSPLDGTPVQEAPLESTACRSMVDRTSCASDESHQAATACKGPPDSLEPTERVKAPPSPFPPPPPPPPSIIKEDSGDLRQKQQQQQQQQQRANNQEQQKNCSQLANKRTKTQIQAATG